MDGDLSHRRPVDRHRPRERGEHAPVGHNLRHTEGDFIRSCEIVGVLNGRAQRAIAGCGAADPVIDPVIVAVRLRVHEVRPQGRRRRDHDRCSIPGTRTQQYDEIVESITIQPPRRKAGNRRPETQTYGRERQAGRTLGLLVARSRSRRQFLEVSRMNQPHLPTPSIHHGQVIPASGRGPRFDKPPLRLRKDKRRCEGLLRLQIKHLHRSVCQTHGQIFCLRPYEIPSRERLDGRRHPEAARHLPFPRARLGHPVIPPRQHHDLRPHSRRNVGWPVRIQTVRHKGNRLLRYVHPLRSRQKCPGRTGEEDDLSRIASLDACHEVRQSIRPVDIRRRQGAHRSVHHPNPGIDEPATARSLPTCQDGRFPVGQPQVLQPVSVEVSYDQVLGPMGHRGSDSPRPEMRHFGAEALVHVDYPALRRTVPRNEVCDAVAIHITENDGNRLLRTPQDEPGRPFRDADPFPEVRPGVALEREWRGTKSDGGSTEQDGRAEGGGQSRRRTHDGSAGDGGMMGHGFGQVRFGTMWDSAPRPAMRGNRRVP